MEAGHVHAPHRRDRFVPPGEGFHVATALVGLIAAILGGAWLVARAESPLATGAAAFYAFGASVLFLATTLHHLRPASIALRRFDHASIYLMMAATAAPVFLVALGGETGRLAFLLVAALAILGVSLKAFGPFVSPRANLALYVPVAAPVVWAAASLARATPPATLALFLGGLFAFGVGALIDAWEWPRVPRIGAHGAFHVLVLVGHALTFAFVAGAAVS